MYKKPLSQVQYLFWAVFPIYCKMWDKERTYSQGEEKETESTETFNKDIIEELHAKWENKV